MHQNKTCQRCTIINVDPETGLKSQDGEPLKTLNKFRFYDYGSTFIEERKKRIIGPPLSINCGVDTTGPIQVGDSVFVYCNKE